MLPCIICGTEPTPAFPQDEDLSRGLTAQPYGATAFITYGHYGSTVFDEMGRQYLYIILCDECVKSASQRKMIALCTPVPPIREAVQEKLWDYTAEEDPWLESEEEE